MAESSDQDENLTLPSIFVGTVTAAVGFLYSRLLHQSIVLLWESLPRYLAAMTATATIATNANILNPVYFIPAMLTTGGLVIGLLSARFPDTFMVSDFVTAFSKRRPTKLPSSKLNLLPLLGMSLLTSAFGFSKGPEAPMVCAGGLIGASMARFIFGDEDDNDLKKRRHQDTLAFAGAAGTLTAFMGIPIAGSIFALEMIRPNEGLRQGEKSLPPSVIASLAALFLLRGVLSPTTLVGGHFSYGTLGDIQGRTLLSVAVGAGLGGALVGTAFHRIVSGLKKVFWYPNKTSSGPRRTIIVKTIIGLMVGCLGIFYPQVLLFGEGSLQSMIDGQVTAFSATSHGFAQLISKHALVNPHIPFASWTAGLQIFVAKFFAIALTAAGKFPGGIIFPLFYAAAPLAHAFTNVLPSGVLPIAVMCLMSATQASATRTPLASALILSLTASSQTDLSVMLPATLVASYLSVYLSRKFSRKAYFDYDEE